jgi:hypothetical protein
MQPRGDGLETLQFSGSALSRRHIVKTLNLGNTLSRRLILAAAGLALCPYGAFAVGTAGDAQMLARDLLSGTVGGQRSVAAADPAKPTDDSHENRLDPQEQARDLILGIHPAGAASQTAGAGLQGDQKDAASLRVFSRAESGGQELAEEMILGKGG